MNLNVCSLIARRIAGRSDIQKLSMEKSRFRVSSETSFGLTMKVLWMGFAERPHFLISIIVYATAVLRNQLIAKSFIIAPKRSNMQKLGGKPRIRNMRILKSTVRILSRNASLQAGLQWTILGKGIWAGGMLAKKAIKSFGALVGLLPTALQIIPLT